MQATPRSVLPKPVAAADTPLDLWVNVPGGTYRLGDDGAERVVTLPRFRIGRYPVTVAQAARFAAATPRLALVDPGGTLAAHPATDLTFEDAEAFCAWASDQLGYPVRLPTGDEWEAAARGQDRRRWPWGDTFDVQMCACVEAGIGWTVPVDSHPAGASPAGVEQMAANVWEWVLDRDEDGWRTVRGGSYLDHAWGVRCARTLSADPARATRTTGIRLVTHHADERREQHG
jgi:formylglycine-generating enzyme required for sulfatase activity